MAGLERADDGIRLRLEAAEVEVLTSLAEGLARRAASGGLGEGDTVLDRLAPPASRGDAAADAELRPMLRGDLLAMRSARLDAFVASLRGDAGGRDGSGAGFDRVLDPEEAMRVVEALNDLRLALAATIGYDEALRDGLHDDDHRADAVRLMDALAWLQGGLIEYVATDPSR